MDRNNSKGCGIFPLGSALPDPKVIKEMLGMYSPCAP